MNKKTKWIIGGGVTLAILAAIGAGVGVTLSTPNSTIATTTVVKKELKSKIDSFLSAGLVDEVLGKNSLNLIKSKLDENNVNTDEIKKRNGKGNRVLSSKSSKSY